MQAVFGSAHGPASSLCFPIGMPQVGKQKQNTCITGDHFYEGPIGGHPLGRDSCPPTGVEVITEGPCLQCAERIRSLQRCSSSSVQKMQKAGLSLQCMETGSLPAKPESLSNR